ncbi:MAG TPA: DUF4434 domain-containing protein [Pyrinomonadaceae bacterium]|nr:DUF4434 domain-containing protein [Pyrinomonadaceae bacterium]
MQERKKCLFGLTSVVIVLLSLGAFANAQEPVISVTVDRQKIEKGDKVEVTIKSSDGAPVQAVLLKPTVGTAPLELHPDNARVCRTAINIDEKSPDGLYVVHAWTGPKEHPMTVGKASFRVGNIVADYLVANYIDKQNPADDLDKYLKDFRSIGGNFLIAHNLITTDGAYYPSKIAKSSYKDDLVELTLRRADREGIPVLLSVRWDMTRDSPYAARMNEIKSIASELYRLYRHHPSLAGFYSYQEGSGTYFAAYVREFAGFIKSLDRGLLTACAPHIDDPLLASYLSVIDDLDMMIYQSAVMASYRPDNRKKYPPRRVRDFSGLGAGAKRVQNKIVLTHVELFAYMEKRLRPEILTASPVDIYDQIMSAAAVTDTDGIALFTYQVHIYDQGKRFREVEKSRKAVADAMKAYQVVTSQVTDKRNPLALYIPYSDFIVERWTNYFLPALDAFRKLGVPIDILPYAPREDEGVYPYYPIHMNPAVLERLLAERTVLVLANVSGFQQTDSDLIKAFVERGGVVVAFGPEIPMGRTYERGRLFGGNELPPLSHRSLTVRKTIGPRVSAGRSYRLPRVDLASWKAVGADVIAAFDSGDAAVVINKFGKGAVITILPDAHFAAVNFPELVRDALDFALRASGNEPLVDIVGANENVETAIRYVKNGFVAAIANQNISDVSLTLGRPAVGLACSFSQARKMLARRDQSIKFTIPPGERVVWNCTFKK